MRLVMIAALAITVYGAENADYDAARQGQLPPGWSVATNHKWEVRSDKTAPSHPNVLLAQSANAEAETPFALFDKVVCLDGDLSVKFRIDGAQQRGNAAGIVWRYQDPNNFYLLSLSADERNIVLQRVRNGVSEVVSTSGGKRAGAGVEEDIRAGQWHLVKVAFRGPKVRVFFGNRSLFTADDAGVSGPGRTGLWVKGAKGAAFDDFRIDKKG